MPPRKDVEKIKEELYTDIYSDTVLEICQIDNETLQFTFSENLPFVGKKKDSGIIRNSLRRSQHFRNICLDLPCHVVVKGKTEHMVAKEQLHGVKIIINNTLVAMNIHNKIMEIWFSRYLALKPSVGYT